MAVTSAGPLAAVYVKSSVQLGVRVRPVAQKRTSVPSGAAIDSSGTS